MPHRRRLVIELVADLVGALVLAILVFMMLVRVTLPRLEQWREHVEGWATQALGQPVRVTEVQAYWRGLDPTLWLRGVEVLD